ncbi:MAG TPA: bleomycin resistance protein, partial [Burkholderiaceae bacterium]
MKLWFNLLCRDVEAQMRFYEHLLGWPEAVASRSPIYRALESEGVQFGFNALPAYALLGLANRQPASVDGPVPVTAYATFMLDSPTSVDAA